MSTSSFPSGREILWWLIKLPLFLLSLALCIAIVIFGYSMYWTGDAMLKDQSASVATAAPPATISNGLTYDTVTAEDWGRLPYDATAGIYNKAERLYKAKRRSGAITGPIISDGFAKR